MNRIGTILFYDLVRLLIAWIFQPLTSARPKKERAHRHGDRVESALYKRRIPQMKRVTRVIIAVALLFVVAGCSTKMKSELFFRDLDDLSDGDLTNKIVFNLPLTSMDECEEYKTRYDRVFRKSKDFKDMEFVKCVEGDFQDSVEYEMDVSLRMIDPGKKKIEGAVEFIRWDADDESEERGVLIRANPPSLHDLDELLKDEFFQGLDLTDSAPLLRISNDMRSDQVFTVHHVFVQGKPVITATSFTLESRDSIDVVLSDVSSAYIFHISETADPRLAPIGVWTTPDEEE